VSSQPATPNRPRYVAAVIAFGTLAVALAVVEIYRNPPAADWLVLVALTVLAGCFTVKLPSVPANLSVSETFIFTAVLLFGPAAGSITVLVDVLVIAFWTKSTRTTFQRFLFNLTAPVIAIRAASACFFLATGADTGAVHRVPVSDLVMPVFAMAVIYFVVNTCLIAGAVLSQGGRVPLEQWRKNLPAVAVNYFLGSSIAIFMVAFADGINLGVVGIIVPILLVSYHTFRTSMGRLEDANRHVSHISELYLSTIEALAMAVDAKDQITHGHIRRVQVYATLLAQRLGVTDQHQLRAIEAAALLHDMGKLAIPEYILNKPGKLTVAEFEKMKRHADIGADLLSSISFPYPVIPIVRHHHENWDGTGYPSRLSKHDIPLGARILSVVDCFDALTSDRPYRPALSNDESFDILRERRGRMYDPLVVDTFIEVFPEISPAAIQAGQQARTLVPTLAISKPNAGPLEQIRITAAQSSVLGECPPALAHTTSVREAFDVANQFIGMLIPQANACVLFKYSPESETLAHAHATGIPTGLLDDLRIPKGERTTGWAVANQTVMANSPAELDLQDRAEKCSPPLKIAMVAPLERGGAMLGALAVYSISTEPFTADHQYAMERIAAAFAEHVPMSTAPALVRQDHKPARTK
jgi:putative nucleotidyltransferase with HDIG domain